MSSRPSQKAHVSSRSISSEPQSSRSASAAQVDSDVLVERSISASPRSPSLARSLSSCPSQSSASESSDDPGKKHKATLKDIDKDIEYWAQGKKERRSSATSSVFIPMAAADTRSQDRLFCKLGAIRRELEHALERMSPLFPVTSAEDRVQYNSYASHTHHELTVYRKNIEQGKVVSPPAARHLSGASLIRKLIPKFDKDILETSQAMECLTTDKRKDRQYIKEVRGLLVEKRQNLQAYEDCEVIQQTLRKYAPSKRLELREAVPSG